MSADSRMIVDATLDESPSSPCFAANEHPDALAEGQTAPQDAVDDPEAHDDDPLDPIDGKTTRMDLPPPEAQAENASWANEVPSKLEMIDDLTLNPPPPVAPETSPAASEEAVDYSRAWDTRPPPEMMPPAEPTSSVFEALDSNAQREVEEPLAGATTWKPTADRAITDLDLSERAQFLQEANAETRPSIDRTVEKVVLGKPITLDAPMIKALVRVPERVLVESSPAGVLPEFAPRAKAIERSPIDMMPEEATLAGGPPAAMQDEAAKQKLSPDETPDDPDEEAVEDPSQTLAGPLTPAPILPGDEAPTFAPEHNSDVARAALQEAREASAIRAARRAPTKIDEAAIVDEALGSHQRYLITVAFAILGLLAGVATALLS